MICVCIACEIYSLVVLVMIGDLETRRLDIITPSRCIGNLYDSI